MSGIRSYDLSGDDVVSLITALESDDGRDKWVAKLRKWSDHRTLQLRILDLARAWLREHGLRTGAHKDGAYEHTRPDEENLGDWVHYQMEYMSGLTWDEKTQEVIVHKYASSRPLLSEDSTKTLLEFLTSKIRVDKDKTS